MGLLFRGIAFLADGLFTEEHPPLSKGQGRLVETISGNGQVFVYAKVQEKTWRGIP